MKKAFFLLASCSLLLFSCKKPSMQQQILGKWIMVEIYENEEEVSHVHNPGSERTITFYEDGTFESDGAPYGPNTGKWTIMEETGVLYIFSDTENDDSDWNIVIDGNNMLWQGLGSEREESFRIVYKKLEDN